MGKTLIEKILSTHTEDAVKPGEIVWIDLDVISARDFGGPNVVKHYEREYDGTPPKNPESIFFTFDLVAPPKTIKYANNQQICRELARKFGIKVYDVDMGIGTHILFEEGHIFPGSSVIGTDSHMNILGAFLSFGQGMGDVDVAFAFKTSKTWFEVPETIKVILRGKYEFPTTAKDLTLYILKIVGTKRALSKAIEFYGEIFDTMDMAARITLSSMVTEMGGIIGFPPLNEKSMDFIKRIIGEENVDFPQADPDANYAETIEIDIDKLKPQVAAPPNPSNVEDAEKFKDVKIDTVFIGSCTNGRTEDFEIAAKILKGRKIASGVTLKIVPATKRVWGELLFKGILKDLYEAGAIISNPSCAGCAEGHIGMTGKGEIQISTGNRNFPGKQGEGLTYLASPAVAAASALTGKIADPREVIE